MMDVIKGTMTEIYNDLSKSTTGNTIAEVCAFMSFLLDFIPQFIFFLNMYFFFFYIIHRLCTYRLQADRLHFYNCKT